jgi:CubicO group peptidase (beta-lactamase class C family)
MKGMARPVNKKRKSRGWSRAADVTLIGLVLIALGIFAVTKFIGGRAASSGAGNGTAERAAGGGASTIGSESAVAPSDFADLEPGPDEFEGDNGDEPLAGPAIVSDPGAARPFSPVDDARLAARLDPEIERALKAGRIPSMAVVCFSGERIVWTRSAGLANIRVKTAAACDTVYIIASTFKTMSATALLQLMDQGKFKLDDRVNDYLGDIRIEGENKRFPVTFRHLLTHTSGLPTDFGRHAVWEDQVPLSLTDYLRGHLQLARRPGTRVLYSNIAFTLVAYLVEKFSGMPFKEYMDKNVFGPLEMRDTDFEPRADMAERLAIPYMPVRRRPGVFRPVDWVKADAWPAGVVYGTALDQGFTRGAASSHPRPSARWSAGSTTVSPAPSTAAGSTRPPATAWPGGCRRSTARRSSPTAAASTATPLSWPRTSTGRPASPS